LTKPADGGENDELSLTLDVGLKPALEVSGTLRQKAENIFEKEQQFVVAAAVQQNDAPQELLYVNDHGYECILRGLPLIASSLSYQIPYTNSP